MLQQLQAETKIEDVLPSTDWAAWDASADHPTATAAFVDTCAAHASHGFRAGVVCHRQGGRLIAGAAMFRFDFRLDMPLGPGFRAIGDRLNRLAPSLLKVPLLCLGSPHSDRCALVLDPTLDRTGRRRALAALVDAMLEEAHRTGAHVIAIKDLPGPVAEDLHPVLAERGFARSASLPVATLDLPFADQDGYLASLSSKMRSDLRRKLRKSAGVELVIENDAEQIAGTLDRLYEETRLRSKADYDDFDALPAGFVPAILKAMGSAARLVTSRVGGEIAGFNLFLTHKQRAVAYKIGLAEGMAREHNLYFLNWLWMVRHCIAGGIEGVEMGQTTYDLKKRLGCRLEPSWIYYRHRMAGWNSIFRVVGPHVSFARMDPELRRAGYRG